MTTTASEASAASPAAGAGAGAGAGTPAVPAAAPRIYWLTTEFFPPETGGTGMIVSRLAQGLAARGFAVQVMTRQVLPQSPAHELVERVQVRRIDPPGRMKGAGWRAFPAMLAFIARLAIALIAERRNYDLVVVSGMKTIPITAIPVCRLLRKPCVVRVESPFEMVEPISAESLDMMHGIAGRLLSGLLKVMQRSVLRRASCVIAISEDIASMLLRLEHPPVRIARIANAVDLTKFAPAPGDERAALRTRLGFPAGRTIVLYVGRLSRAKGVMMLLEAWPDVVARFPDAYLVMVGSGKGSWDDCEADIVQFVRSRELEPHIALAGHSDRVQDFLQAADLFVAPSDYEGFSLTLVEALGCALPVVTTTVGAAPQIIREGENGFLCPPKDKPALEAALERALGQRARFTDIGRAARASVEEFGIPQVVEQYVALLRELAAGSPPK
jgi:glycosyltransferase involved in cell wall biosynthesis